MAHAQSPEQTLVLSGDEATAEAAPALDDLILDEWDFEEISIDGICGVY